MDNKKLNQLKDALTALIPFPQEAHALVQRAGINAATINWGSSPLVIWNSIVGYAEVNAQLYDLVNTVLTVYPGNPHLLAFKETSVQDYSLGPSIREIQWKNDTEPSTLEKIMGSESTLLPINFLALGLQKSKSVCRIEIRVEGKIELGTGFLLRNNLILTNYHVLPDATKAKDAIVKFDYEESITGSLIQPTEFALDPDDAFATGGSKTDDWSIVRIKGDANNEYNSIDLTDAEVKKNDFVNIIQHPGGRTKQIGLYHNMVTYANDEIVQYLTDTEPGSSGSPVFDSEWNVVAIHHSGGMLREPNIRERLLRNEGIPIKKVKLGIKTTGLLPEA